MRRRSPLLALAALCACGTPRAEGPQPTAAGAPDTAALRRDIPGLMRTADVPGLSIAVVRDGRVVWADAFGTVNDSAATPVDTGTVFEAASLSKPVFAYLVLRLADRGELDLDRPLHELVPYPRLAHDERHRRITARMVLSHGTGLPNWGGERLELRFDPGSAYGYSGEGFVFLQKAIERATGRSLEELARREVFQPLGMTRSGFVWREEHEGRAAHAKDWLWYVAPVHRYTEGNAAYTLLTTAPDYARFVAGVLTGRGLSPRMWKRFLTPERESSPGLSVGLGIRVEQGPAGRVFWHSGNNGRRFTAYMTGHLDQGLGLVYFASSYSGTSLVEPLAGRVFGRGRPPRNWADFDRHDDPRRLALRSVQRAAMDSGADAARARLREISRDPSTRPDADGTLRLAAFLSERGFAPVAVEMLERLVAAAPESAEAHVALGGARERAGDLPGAIAAYRQAETLDPGEADEARALIRWAEERMASLARPAAVARETLARYAGRYQERTVTLRGERLFYGGSGRPESPLRSMGPALFEVESDPAMRLRFIAVEAGPASKMLGIYSDGTVDEWTRSPEDYESAELGR